MLWSCSEDTEAPAIDATTHQSETFEQLSPYDKAALEISQKAIASITGTSRSGAPLLTLKETLRYPQASRSDIEKSPITIFNFNEGGYSVLKNIAGYPELLVLTSKYILL